MELGKEEDFGDEAVVSATSGISYVSPIQQELALIKRQVYKSAEKKWKKCWKIAEINEFKENSQRHGPVETQRKENVSKTY